MRNFLRGSTTLGTLRWPSGASNFLSGEFRKQVAPRFAGRYESKSGSATVGSFTDLSSGASVLRVCNLATVFSTNHSEAPHPLEGRARPCSKSEANVNNVVPEFRHLAIEAAGGVSSPPIYSLVFTLIEHAELGGSALDFGAGTGELTRQLVSCGRFAEVAGADALPRPSILPPRINWLQCDLNEPIGDIGKFDVIICAEVIEHLENPRATFRTFSRLLKSGGALVLTTPNQESIRSFISLVARGHFSGFMGASYPAHITALLRLDLERICSETGFDRPVFAYSNHGGIPKMPRLTWQDVTGSLARGRLFSDNLGMLTKLTA